MPSEAGAARTAFTPTDETHRVTTLELLFDLVFVFAITAVTSFMAHHLTALGLVEGLVITALMWFGWSAYAWLGNQARADEGALRVSMLFAMAAFFVVALTIPEAFDDRPGGLSGPLVFVVAYAVVRLSHLAVYSLAAGDDAELRRTVRQAFVTTLPAMLLLGAGASAAHPGVWCCGRWPSSPTMSGSSSQAHRAGGCRRRRTSRSATSSWSSWRSASRS